MTATKTAPERAEINRRNARKSTGPRTPEGKDRSKFNALKHGLDAKTPVLPGEDAEAYRKRIDAWTADFRPSTHYEQFLVEQAAHVSWQIERVERAEAARLSENIRTAKAELARCVEHEVAVLGKRLLQSPIAPDPPNLRQQLETGQTSCNASITDGHPSQLIMKLESTSSGCRWLLARWAELRAILDQGGNWAIDDQYKAIRLLGQDPLERVSSPLVNSIALACKRINVDLVHSAKSIGAPAEPAASEIPSASRPLTLLIARSIARLDAISRVLNEQEDAETAELANRLSFDDSNAGERLRRLQMYCGRSFFRMLDILLKMRRSNESSQPIPTRVPLSETSSDQRSGEQIYSSIDFNTGHAQTPISLADLITNPVAVIPGSKSSGIPSETVSLLTKPQVVTNKSAPEHPATCDPVKLNRENEHAIFEPEDGNRESPNLYQVLLQNDAEENRWNEATIPIESPVQYPHHQMHEESSEADRHKNKDSTGVVIGVTRPLTARSPLSPMTLVSLIDPRAASGCKGNRKTRRQRKKETTRAAKN